MTLIFCGALVGLGLFLLVRTLIPNKPQLQDALERLDPATLAGAITSRRYSPTQADNTDLTDRVGAWVERRISHRTGFTPPRRDLDLIGQTPAWYYGKKALASLIGLTLIPILATLSTITPAITISPFIPVGAGLIIAAFFWFLPDADIKKQAAAARAEFVRVAVAYLQLVTIKLSAGGTPSETMTDAATLSDHWVMVRIRQEMVRAQFAGIAPWDALNELADRVAIPEIHDIGDIMRLAGEQGARVRDSLAARAASIQHRLLSEAESEAHSRTTRMNVPVTALLGIFVLALLYPAVIMVLGV